MEIGGVNLFRDSMYILDIENVRGDWNKGSWGRINAGEVTKVDIIDAPNNNIRYGYHLKASSGNYATICQENIPLCKGKTYTASYYVKGTGKTFISVQSIEPQGGVKNSETITIDSEWKKITYSFIAEGASYYLGIYTRDESDCFVCGFKLEYGTVATDCSLAPEDMLLKYEVDGRNLFVQSRSMSGCVDSSGLYISDRPGMHCTDYELIDNATYLTMQQWGKVIKANEFNEGIYISIAYYDSDKIFIGRDSKTFLGTSTDIEHIILSSVVPENAYYYRASTTNDLPYVENAKTKLERGSIATDWTPAPEDYIALEERVAALEAAKA